MRCSILIKTEMVENTKSEYLAEVDQGEKKACFCLSYFLLETLNLLGFKETTIRQKFNTQQHFSKMPLLQKALKKSQAFEEFFSFPEILLFCFEHRRQRNNAAQSLECPLSL